MNIKAFGNVFRNLQKSFHTFARCSGLNNRGYWLCFQLNKRSTMALLIYKKRLGVLVNQYAIVKLKKWSIIIIWFRKFSQRFWKLYCELRTTLRKALLFITENLNSATECLHATVHFVINILRGSYRACDNATQTVSLRWDCRNVTDFQGVLINNYFLLLNSKSCTKL